ALQSLFGVAAPVEQPASRCLALLKGISLGKFFEHRPQALEVSHHEQRPCGARADMHSPSSVMQSFKYVFISTIVASSKQKIRVGVSSQNTFHGLTLVCPHGPYLDSLLSAEGPYLRLGKHGFKHRE